MARGDLAAYSCFEPYEEDAQEYARATYLVPTSCESEAVSILSQLRARAPEFRDDGPDAYFNAEQNALVARNAELYYGTMVRGGAGSWNVRDNHMVETLNRLMTHHGPGAPMQRMRVPEAREGSHEHAMRESGAGDSIFLFARGEPEETSSLREVRGHRAIGVVYDPRTGHWGNYVPTILPGRYDAFIYIEETNALDPLHMPVKLDGEVPETFPSGQ